MDEELTTWSKYHQVKLQNSFDDLYHKIPSARWYELRQWMQREDVSVRLAPFLDDATVDADEFYFHYLESRHTDMIVGWIRQCLAWKQLWSTLHVRLLQANIALPETTPTTLSLPELLVVLQENDMLAIREQVMESLEAHKELMRELPLLKKEMDERISFQRMTLNKEYETCAAYVRNNARDMHTFYSATSNTGLQPLGELIPNLEKKDQALPLNAAELLTRYKEALLLSVVHKKVLELL